MMQMALSNAVHPEYGVVTIPFPIPEEEYGHCLELLEALEIGNAVNRDCKVQEVQDGPPILKRLEGSRVNLDELDYLAKRLDSFTDQELAQFQSAAVSYNYSNIVDLINLTFSCQEVTVITDFSDLESIGRNHYMTLNGGSARMEELDNLDGTETALLLIESGDGVITPYGVVYDNCMRLSQDYDGRHLPEYYYTRCTVSVMLSADGRPEQQEMLYFPCAESKISRAVRRLGVTVLFSRGDTQFTLESLVYGCFQGGIFAGVVLWLAVFGRVLGSDRLLAVTGRAAPRFSLLFSMTLGCIARFRENARQIRLARAGAGLAKEKPLQEALDQFSTLVTLSLEGSMTTADAMRARGYGKGRRRVYDPFTFGVADGVELAVVLLLSITVLAVALTGGLTFYFDPQLEWVTLSPLGAAAAGLLCFCPTISNVGETLQWRRLKRKN